jgi:hypothetical protein
VDTPAEARGPVDTPAEARGPVDTPAEARGPVDTPADAAAAPAATTSPGVAPTPFTFTIEGSYFAVRRMLAALGRFARVKRKVVSVSGRLLTLDSIKVSPGRKTLPQIKADISAKAYVAPMPPAPGGGGATAPAPLTTPATSAPAAQVTP